MFSLFPSLKPFRHLHKWLFNPQSLVTSHIITSAAYGIPPLSFVFTFFSSMQLFFHCPADYISSVHWLLPFLDFKHPAS